MERETVSVARVQLAVLRYSVKREGSGFPWGSGRSELGLDGDLVVILRWELMDLLSWARGKFDVRDK